MLFRPYSSQAYIASLKLLLYGPLFPYLLNYYDSIDCSSSSYDMLLYSRTLSYKKKTTTQNYFESTKLLDSLLWYYDKKKTPSRYDDHH